MKILVFGSCNLDKTYSVEHIVTPGETISVSHLKEHPGGKGLNQAIAAARAGGDVFFAGCIGRDGETLRNLLRESGADVSYLKTTDLPTGQAVIQVDRNGQNCILLYSGANGAVSKEEIDRVLEDFGPEDLLMLQNEIANIPYLIEKAFQRGIPILLNPSPFDETMQSIDLNKISWLILNEVEAAGYYPDTDPKEAIRRFRLQYPGLNVVLTLGAAGCIAEESEQIEQPAFSVSVRDTTGAGDTFTGYFAAGIAEKLSLKKRLLLATAAAAQATTEEGAASSIPLREKAEEMLRSKPSQITER